MSDETTNADPGSAGVNPSRGEVAITLGGKSYVMRSSFAAIRRMESMAGKGAVRIVARFQEGDFAISDVAAVITAGINANPENRAQMTFDEVGELISQEGLIAFLEPASRFLGGALTAGPKKGN